MYVRKETTKSKMFPLKVFTDGEYSIRERTFVGERVVKRGLQNRPA